MDLNLSLYLVTDSTRAILGDRDLAQVVDDAIKGGVTIVQYREKVADTGTMVATAKKLHQITQKHGVPLLINDRVDVALAVGAEGVHLGQDDMDLQTARMLMGDKAIIGISANNANEAHIATEGGADYLGIGAVFATPTYVVLVLIARACSRCQGALQSNRNPLSSGKRTPNQFWALPALERS